MTVPQYGGPITLSGHQSKILVTDFTFGSKSILYSTAEVLTYSVVDGKEVLALWVPTGESGEFAIRGVDSAKMASCNGCANVEIHRGESNVTVSFMQNAGMSVVELGDGSRVVLLDRTEAYRFWSPHTDNDPLAIGNQTSESGCMEWGVLLLTVHSPRPRSLSCPLGDSQQGHAGADWGRRQRNDYYGLCAQIHFLPPMERKGAGYHVSEGWIINC